MYENLKAEFVRRGINPYEGIMAATGCSYGTARKKIKGASDFTVTEAGKITGKYFPDLAVDYLFCDGLSGALCKRE